MKNSEIRSKQAENILYAAKRLFAQQGYHGTNTKEIARLADIAENTLFRYFERKEELFWAVLRSTLSGFELRLDLLALVAQGAGPEEVLPKLVTQLIDLTILRPDLLRLIAIALIELPWKASAVLHEYLSPTISAVNEYVSKSIESGKLRKLDSSLVTTAIIATVIGYPSLSGLLSATAQPYSDRREAIRAYSKFWIEILAPPGVDLFRTAQDFESH
ncbi:MAG TPA: helix-turn-helix domain-containing protein [Terracidiphilus sp.]|nr:helix-turn-helix domain-containing protein [Terracidiphilus sp.]